MIRVSGIKAEVDYKEGQLLKTIAHKLKIDIAMIKRTVLFKRSIDARAGREIKFNITVDVELADQNREKKILSKKFTGVSAVPDISYNQPISQNPEKRVVVVGTGPAGLFASLVLARSGIKPIILERGEPVELRMKSIDNLLERFVLNTESNVAFGEGGAGTFSDGKLNTGTKDKRNRFVLEEFVKHGSPAEILWQGKPHIGTDKLRKTIVNIRTELENLGCEIIFNARFCDFNIDNNKISEIIYEKNNKKYNIKTDCLVLALGHSARDTFEMLQQKNIAMQAKPFAIGVRIEHSQKWLNEQMFHEFAGNARLGSATYKLAVHTSTGRGLYSFCMCPGGEVVPAMTENNSIVVNGMSYFARSGKNCNSALLVGVAPEDIAGDNPLKGIEFQRKIEQKAFEVTKNSGNFNAPYCTVGEFLKSMGKSANNNFKFEIQPTYKPNVFKADFREIFPDFITNTLAEGILMMGQKIKGFDSADAIMTAPESRSSSPVRICRDESFQSISLGGLYPCGEGAGYAGGIVSAAVDGIKIAEMIIREEI